MENTKSYPFYFKLASVVIAIIGLVYIAIWAKMVIVPLIIGLLLAIILTPIARFFENKLKFPRSVSAITSTVLLTLVVLFIMFLLGTQMRHMAGDLPAFKEQLISALEKLQDWISEEYNITNEEQLKYLTDNASQSIGIGTTVIEGTISSLSSIGMLLIFIFLYTLFILMYRKHIISFLLLCFKDSMKPKVHSAIADTQIMVKNYLIGLLIQMSLITVFFLIAYSIIGLKYIFLLAIMTGIINIIPYIGIIFSMLVAMLIAFATGTPTQVLLVVISVVIIHAIDGNIIMPRIIGSKVKVNSLAVIIGLVLGEKMWGILGMLLTIPVLAMVKIIFDHIQELNAWGYLLGEEESIKIKSERRRQRTRVPYVLKKIDIKKDLKISKFKRKKDS